LSFAERLPPPIKFRVDQWLLPNEEIDLGERKLKVIAAPGHTRESIILYDSQRHLAFAGDFIYQGELITFLPGGSTTDYQASSQSLVQTLHPLTKILPGHGPWNSPNISLQDLKAINLALGAYIEGLATTSGFFPRKLDVNANYSLLVSFPWSH
jgi:hydroxyacylglutathione hydrolase